jgi:integrase
MVSYHIKTPKLVRNKTSGRGVVRLNGRDIYCGKFGTPECEAKYHAVIAEWLAQGRRSPADPTTAESLAATDLTVNELALAYLEFADGYYQKNGRPTTETRDIRYSIRPLREHFGLLTVDQFNPQALKVVRQAMIGAGLCRNEANKRTRRIVRMFAWGVEEGRVPAAIHWALKTVKGLKKGRGVRESRPVKPVPDAFVDAIQPFVSPPIWAMIAVQRLTGMRPQEVCLMRTIDIDTSGKVWIYVPATHKTEHHGKSREIYIGPQAQAILRPWLRAELTAYLFSPREAMDHRQAERRRSRKTPLTPSLQNQTRKARPRRSPGERYSTRSYYHAVQYGIARANQEAERLGNPPIPSWHPNQLRHSAATRLRKAFGVDTARIILGHSSPVATEVYAELDRVKGIDAIAHIG